MDDTIASLITQCVGIPHARPPQCSRIQELIWQHVMSRRKTTDLRLIFADESILCIFHERIDFPVYAIFNVIIKMGPGLSPNAAPQPKHSYQRLVFFDKNRGM